MDNDASSSVGIKARVLIEKSGQAKSLIQPGSHPLCA